jgi:acyl-CoA synthetase (AMP-forming)/AMP-acid ligase II
MYHLCLQDRGFSSRDLTSVETLLFFGGPLPVGVLRTLGERTGARLATGWGMTETAGGCTLTDPDADLDTLATTVGRADPRVELKLVDDAGVQVAVGDAGEIRVRGDVLFLGYLNQPEATTEAMDADGFLRTGDIAIVQPDGNVRLVGRKKEMFKSGGYNVYPTEVEAVLGEHPGVAIAGVLPIDDELWGEVGVAFVAPRSSVTAPTSDELNSFCRERLANYKVPKRYVISDEIPILPSGKVDKRSLKEWRLEDHD